MLTYRGLHGVLERLIVSEAQVDRQIQQLIEQHPRIIPVADRPSRLDDELVLDYAGYVDGVPFEGGAAERQTLTLGSGAFIPGFEDQLVGYRAGDAVDVRVTFPARYHAPHLAGKEAVFKCKIHEIRVKQKYEPNDGFAREIAGLDSFEALRQRVREGLQAYADGQAEEELRARLLDQAMADFDCAVSPDQLERAVDAQLRSLEAQLQRQRLTLDDYCRFMGKTRDQLREESRPDAERAVRRQQAIAEIAEREHIEADEASVAAAIQDICRQNHMSVEQLSAMLDDAAQSAIVRNVITGKVLDLIRESAVIDTVER